MKLCMIIIYISYYISAYIQHNAHVSLDQKWLFATDVSGQTYRSPSDKQSKNSGTA